MRAVLVRTARDWGLKPSDLGICAPDDDLVYMVAWTRAETHMMAWEQRERDRQQRR